MSDSAWHPDGVPFCWQPKEAFRRIEHGIETEYGASAIVLYVTLTRIASDEESATFEKPIGYIARLAALSRSTVERRTQDLERLGLITVQGQRIPGTKARGLNRYTLTSLSRKVASPCNNLTSRTEARRDAVIEEQKKLSQGDGRENAHIPTEHEFVALFATTGIPESYLRSKWSWFEGNNAWLDRHGRLKNFGVLVRSWWGKDRASWRESKGKAEPVSAVTKEVSQLKHDLPLLSGRHRERAEARLRELEAANV